MPHVTAADISSTSVHRCHTSQLLTLAGPLFTGATRHRWALDPTVKQPKQAPCWLHPSGGKPSHFTQTTWISGIQHLHPMQPLCQLLAPPISSPGVDGEGTATSGICNLDDNRFSNPLLLVNSTGDFSGVPLGGVGGASLTLLRTVQ
jgi:hypothetical protein